MASKLDELQRLLIDGQRRSMQGSYDRRRPAAAAVPFLIEARAGLKAYTSENDRDAKAWRLLSQAEECLLNYAAARECLDRAMSLTPEKDRKDLKRLVALREIESAWIELNLTPDQLSDLGDYLDRKLAESGCDHSHRFTREWLRALPELKAKAILEAIRNRGGFCDCEVLNNVVDG